MKKRKSSKFIFFVFIIIVLLIASEMLLRSILKTGNPAFAFLRNPEYY